MDTTGVPNDFLMASYKTFSNQSKSIDTIQARRSLPCASSNIDAERRNERFISNYGSSTIHLAQAVKVSVIVHDIQLYIK